METTISTTRPLTEDATTRATIFDDALTYYADGTRVIRRGHDPRPDTVGTTAGMTVDAVPYQLQVVNWDNGNTTHTAPHVLEKAVGIVKA
jgi:hypothetical protein